MAKRFPFTARDADRVVAAPKTISTDLANEAQGPASLVVPVNMVSGSESELVVKWFGMGLSLCWKGHRIRGINRSRQLRSRPDGTIVRGWHEHVFDDQVGDEKVHAVTGLGRPSVDELVRFCLARWNIQVTPDSALGRQLRFGGTRQ